MNSVQNQEITDINLTFIIIWSAEYCYSTLEQKIEMENKNAVKCGAYYRIYNI